MRKIPLIAAILAGAFTLLFAIPAFAAPYLVGVGGTGSTTPSGILYGDNGVSTVLKTVTIGTGLTFSAGTLSSTGGGGTPGGASSTIQYNANGVFAGNIGLVYTGTNVGIGISTPGALLTVSRQTSVQTPVSGSTGQFVGQDANPLRITFDTHNDSSTSGTALMFRRSRGTSATPLADATDDVLGSLNFRGYGTTGYAAGSTGLMTAKATGAFTDASMPTAITFDTTPVNSVTATERVRIDSTGNVGIGSTSPYAKFAIQGQFGDTNRTLFAIGSSTSASATTTLFSIDNTGTIGTVLAAGTVNSTAAGTIYNTPTSTVATGLGLSYSGTMGSEIGGVSGTLSVATSSLYTGTQGQVAYFNGTNSIVGTSSAFITAAGNVVVGATTAAHSTTTNYPFSVFNTTTLVAALVNTSASGASAGAAFTAASDDGAALASGDRLGVFGFGGSMDGTHNITNQNAGISGFAEQAYSSGAQGANLRLETTPLNGTVRFERGRFTAAGLFGVGSTTPWGQISASSSTAFPTFAVEQMGTGPAGILIGGNVGVGTTSPEFQFETVQSNQSNIITGGVAAAAIMVGTSTNNARVNVLDIRAVSSSSPAVGFGPALTFTMSTSFGSTSNATVVIQAISEGGGNNAVGFTTSAASVPAEKARLTGNGFFGVGTTTPQWRLQGDKSDAPQLALSDASLTNNKWTLRAINNSFYIATASPSTFSTSTAAAVSIDPNGNLTLARVLGISSGGTNIATQVTNAVNYFDGTSITGSANFFLNGTNLRIGTSTGSNNWPVLIGTSTTQNLVLSSNVATADLWAFRALSDGTLAIGTATPSTYATSSSSSSFTLKSNSSTQLGLGSTSPWRTLSVTGSAAIDGLTAASAGTVTVCIDTTSKEIKLGGTSTSCAPSSIRFKRDIATSSIGLAELRQLRPVTFYFKQGEPQQQLGFIAEEVVLVDPRLVQKGTDGQLNGLRLDNFMSLVVNSIQQIAHHDDEQDAKIASLEAQIATLQGQHQTMCTFTP